MTTTSIWAASALLVISALPGVAAEPIQPGSTLTVSIYDLAHVGAKTLEQAEDVATRIFLEAGVEALWTTVSLSPPDQLVSDFGAHTDKSCGMPLHAAVQQLAILAHAPNGFPPQALAYSLPCADRGVQVFVYADRVEEVSLHTLAAFHRVLGHTMAHELGHVLLNSQAHEEKGLMKAVWSKADWQRAAVALIPFTADQARRIAQLKRAQVPRPVADNNPGTEPTSVGCQPLTIVVRDYAEVEPHALERAEREAARILAPAGVQLVWMNCRDSIDSLRQCQEPPDSTGLVLDLLRADATRRRAAPGALGYAVPPESGAFGSYGGVFYDRVERLSSATMSESLLLGYAMSHELGHLLLGVGPHAPGGIMKSEWHKKELMEAAQGTLLFRPEDRSQIGANLRRRVARQQETMNTSTLTQDVY